MREKTINLELTEQDRDMLLQILSMSATRDSIKRREAIHNHDQARSFLFLKRIQFAGELSEQLIHRIGRCK